MKYFKIKFSGKLSSFQKISPLTSPQVSTAPSALPSVTPPTTSLVTSVPRATTVPLDPLSPNPVRSVTISTLLSRAPTRAAKSALRDCTVEVKAYPTPVETVQKDFTVPRDRLRPLPEITPVRWVTSAESVTGIRSRVHLERTKTHQGGGIVRSVRRGIIVMPPSVLWCGTAHTSAHLGITARMEPHMLRSLPVHMERSTIWQVSNCVYRGIAL